MLCEKSFLSLWSYVGLHNDKAKGQEICDLLVVFGDHVIIFSDKNCLFGSSGNIVLDWSRWFRKAITKSIDQVYGAERWIRLHSDRIFLDQAATVPLPISLGSFFD